MCVSFYKNFTFHLDINKKNVYLYDIINGIGVWN